MLKGKKIVLGITGSIAASAVYLFNTYGLPIQQLLFHKCYKLRIIKV